MGVDIGFIKYSEEYEKKSKQYKEIEHVSAGNPAYIVQQELEKFLYPMDSRLLEDSELLSMKCPTCANINGHRYSNFSLEAPVNIESLGCHFRFAPEKETYFPREIKLMLDFIERCLFAYPEDQHCKRIFNILKECRDNNLIITTC